MEVKETATVSDNKIGKMLLEDKEEMPLPAFNHITIPIEDEVLGVFRKEEMTKHKNTPYFNTMARLMYAAGDLASPDADCVAFMINFMKQL